MRIGRLQAETRGKYNISVKLSFVYNYSKFRTSQISKTTFTLKEIIYKSRVCRHTGK